MPALPSSRNQSIDLHSKSIDWFLYQGKTGILWVKQKNTQDHYYVKLTQRQQRPHLNIITVVLVVPLILILNNLHSLLDKIVVIYIFFLSLSSSKYLIEQESSIFNLNSVPKINWNGKCILLKFIFNTWNLSWNLPFWKRQEVSNESFNNCNYMFQSCLHFVHPKKSRIWTKRG